MGFKNNIISTQDEYITSPFGVRPNPLGAGTEFHNGLDIVSSRGLQKTQDVWSIAIADGVVTDKHNGELIGHGIDILHDGKVLSRQYHFKSASVLKVGDKVKKGDRIGILGTTGRSTGVHLHFGVKTGSTKWDNGDYVDPTPYLDGTKNIAISSDNVIPAKIDTPEREIREYLSSKGLSLYAAVGIMGNLYAESGLKANNLQNSYEKSLGFTDDSYTAAVDKGTYTNFIRDCAGYGLAQWTYWSRKEGLFNAAKAQDKSIGNLNMQLDYLWFELTTSYRGVLDELRKAKSVREASDIILTKFEKPADQSEAVRVKRAGYAQSYYDNYLGWYAPEVPTMPEATLMPETPTGTITKGSKVTINANAKYYTGGTIPLWVLADVWYVSSISGDRAVLGKNVSGKNDIQSPINVKDLVYV